jgi:arylsulfatase A-like enzyme
MVAIAVLFALAGLAGLRWRKTASEAGLSVGTLLPLCEVVADPGALDLGEPEGAAALRRGWHPPEREGPHALAWTANETARVLLPAAAREAGVLGLRLRSRSPGVIRVLLGSCPAVELPVGPELTDRIVPVPAGCARKRAPLLTLESTLHRLGGRRVGIALARIAWGRLPGEASSRLERGAWAAGARADGDVLRLQGPVAVRLHLDTASRVRIAADRPAALTVGVQREGEEAAELGRDSRGRFEAEVAASVERPVRLTLSVPAGAEVQVRGTVSPGPETSVRPVGGRAVEGERMDVVLVVLDALAIRYMGAWGDPLGVTPNLDRLARSSAHFETALSAASYTTGSTSTLFTGTLPPVHSVEGFIRHLPVGLPTLAEHLAEAGYRTEAVVANISASAHLGFDRGFSHFEEVRGQPVELRGPAVTQKAAARLGRRADEPLFLYVHYLQPHFPYDPPEPFRRLFSGGRPGGDPTREMMHAVEAADAPGELRQLLIACYRETLAFVDREVGRLVEALRRRGRPTLLLLTSDHGEAFGEHGRFSHSSSVYDEMVRIPLMVEVPGAPAGVRREIAQNVDVLPTVLELLGLEAPAALQGRSLAAPIRDGRDGPGPAPRAFSRSAGERMYARALRIGRHKLIVTDFYETVELYDLAADPGEQQDLAEAHPVRAGYLQQELRRLMLESRVLAARAGPSGDAELGEEETEQLRALGYLE